MHYDKIIKGKFIERPNRFIAKVDIDGSISVCHVKNTGRCKELLVPGYTVILDDKHDAPRRKTDYDLIAVYKKDRLINMDSQAPNVAVSEYLKTIYPVDSVHSEVFHNDSRIDFYVETDSQKKFIEVKGVTLEDNNIAMFPDAPTERGVKHLKNLIECKKNGIESGVIFVIQMSGIEYFTPNKTTHPEFAEYLYKAASCGVDIKAFECKVTEDSMKIEKEIPVKI